MPTGTNTIYFVGLMVVTRGRKVTYVHLVATLRPHKEEFHRVCITSGCNKLNYPGVTATYCSSLTTTKCLLNRTLSTPRSKFLVLDINNFYYNTPMDRY